MFSAMGGFFRLELRFRPLLSNRLHFFVNEGVYPGRVAHGRLFGDLIAIINEFGTTRSATFACRIVSRISLLPSMA